MPLKPVPEVVICEMLRLALPVLLMATDWVALLPMLTFPKLTVAGLTPS